jgi:hypothetical protein
MPEPFMIRGSLLEKGSCLIHGLTKIQLICIGETTFITVNARTDKQDAANCHCSERAGEDQPSFQVASHAITGR